MDDPARRLEPSNSFGICGRDGACPVSCGDQRCHFPSAMPLLSETRQAASLLESLYAADCLLARTPSILRNSSAENARFFSAATLSSTCSTLLVPTSALVTRGSRKTQATAISASDCPRCCATAFSSRSIATL